MLKVDNTTLPRGSVLVISSNRNGFDPGSILVNAKKGELIRADFIEGSASESVINETNVRRQSGRADDTTESRGHRTSGTGGGKSFESRSKVP